LPGRTILVVEDDPAVSRLVEHRLAQEGYRVVVAPDGEQGLRLFEAVKPDLVILDLILPEIDGYEVCRIIRKQSAVPIIVLSAKGDEVDKLVGFRLGADDYVTKPFSAAELAMRVGAVLRRCEGLRDDREGAVLDFGELAIDRRRRTVTVRGHKVELTPKEFDLLWVLASHVEYVFTREQLLYQVWQSDYEGDVDNVTVLVSRLRDKIEENPSQPRFIKTVWGVGYKFSVPKAEQEASP
jgi:DNA-binding response OmpR family regulator